MEAITIRQLPDGTKQRLRLRAATSGHSMEAEARTILVAAMESTARADLSWIEQLVELGHDVGGVELELPVDEPASTAELGKV